MSVGGRGAGAGPGLAARLERLITQYEALETDFLDHRKWARESIGRLEAFRNWLIGIGVGSGVVIGLGVQVALSMLRRH